MAIKKAKIVIIGAGMAGITAANRLYTSSPDLFDLTVIEAGNRVGGRILTSDFAGNRVEVGATWIHGIGGSPIYSIATENNLLEDSSCNWERKGGFPSDPVAIAQGGSTVDRELIVDPICTLHRQLMNNARSGDLNPANSDDVASYLRRGLHQYQTSRTGISTDQESLEASVFTMKDCGQRAYSAADDLSNLSLAAESEYENLPGQHITIAKGYSSIINHLASSLPPDTICFDKILSRVEWCSTSSPPVRLHFNDNTVINADHVIMTVSLGVLKTSIEEEENPGNENPGNGIRFDPPLPDFKKEAIGRLGFGAVDKIFIQIEGADLDSFPHLRMVYDKEGSKGHVSKTPWWMRKTESICPIYNGSHVLLTWVVGKEARHLESLEDEEIIDGIQNTLNEFLPKTGYRVVNVKRSKWATDPLFLGSYSYVAVGSSGDDLDRMAEPLPRGESESAPPMQILFAGEATHRKHYSTTHGAYYSGIREADRLLRFYNGFHN